MTLTIAYKQSRGSSGTSISRARSVVQIATPSFARPTASGRSTVPTTLPITTRATPEIEVSADPVDEKMAAALRSAHEDFADQVYLNYFRWTREVFRRPTGRSFMLPPADGYTTDKDEDQIDYQFGA